MALKQITLRSDLGETLEEDARQNDRDANELANEALEEFLRERQIRKIEREIEAYRGMHAELWKQIPNHWIAVHNGKLVDQDFDRVSLHRRVRKRYRRTAVLIRQVRPEVDEVIWWRTPSTGKITR